MTDDADAGTLVTLEGLDGSGKTTVWEALREQRDPTGGGIAEKGTGSEATREQRGVNGGNAAEGRTGSEATREPCESTEGRLAEEASEPETREPRGSSPGTGVTFTREPTDSWYGDAVYRSIREDDADPLAELFLYTADHADHLSRLIRPALRRGDLVISDRYSDSRYAYQGASLDGVLDDPVEYVRSIHEPFSRPPDLTLYLDVDPETAADRAGATNKFERAEFLERVRENYERLIAAEPERFVRIDAARSPDAVLAEAEAALDARL